MERLEELGPTSQGVFLPVSVCEGLHTSRPEVGAEAYGGQVSEIGKESKGWVHGSEMDARCSYTD
jgi:hypothetical protein